MNHSNRFQQNQTELMNAQKNKAKKWPFQT